jgi:hypothetical protein
LYLGSGAASMRRATSSGLRITARYLAIGRARGPIRQGSTRHDAPTTAQYRYFHSPALLIARRHRQRSPCLRDRDFYHPEVRLPDRHFQPPKSCPACADRAAARRSTGPPVRSLNRRRPNSP